MTVPASQAPSGRPAVRAFNLPLVAVAILALAIVNLRPPTGGAAPALQGDPPAPSPSPSPTFAPYEPAGTWSAIHGPGIEPLWEAVGAPKLGGVHVLDSGEDGVDGWAVGDRCALARFDGEAWSRVTDLESLCGGMTSYDLRDVFMRAADDVWAVGRVIGGSGPFARDCVAADSRDVQRDEGCGFMVHFDGDRWRLLSPGDYGIIRIAPPLNAIDMYFDAESETWYGWAVGNDADYDSLKAIILEYSHAERRWSVTRATNNLVEHLRAVKILSPTDAWIAGDSGTESRFQIAPGDERGQWRRLGLSGRDHLYALDLTERDFGWDGGWRGRMNRYDGNCDDGDDATPCWFDNQAYPIRNAAGNSLTTIDVLAIDLLGLGVGWLVGLADGRTSTVAHLSLEKWYVVPVERDPGRDLHGLFMLSEDLGWAVGQEGTILEYRASGASPSATPTDEPTEFPTSTATPTSAPTQTATPTEVPSPGPSSTPPVPGDTPEPTPDPSPSATAPAASATPTFEDEPTATPSQAPTETATEPVPSATRRPPDSIYLPFSFLRRPRSSSG